MAVPTKRGRRFLFAGTAVATMLAWTAGASAQEVATVAAAPASKPVETAASAGVTDLAGLAEVIVTAQKRETNLQKTPISITVAGAQDLQNRRVQSLADLGDGAIPSLRIAPFFSRNSALSVGIRGIVPADANQPSRDAGVGVYLDGVYLGRSQGLGAALYDIDRIEVLKGPQGTLFGRNATGGAVSIVTKKPTGDFGLRQLIGVRNFGGYSSETHLDLPRWHDLSVKVDAVIAKRDGTTENPLSGTAMAPRDFNSFDRRGLHVRALWEPTTDFSIDYGFDISTDETTPYYLQLLTQNPGAGPLAPLVQIQPGRAEAADVGVPEQPSVGHTYGHTLLLSWRPTEALELRSISSYRQLKQNQFDNGGAHSSRFAPNGLFSRYSLAQMHQKQWSQELQLLGSAERLTYVAGLYYYHEEGDDWAWTPNTLQWNATGTAYSVLPSLVAGQQTPFPDRFSNAFASSYAAFGQATWSPLDPLHLTLGGRWTHDKKHGALLQSQGAPTPYTFSFDDNRFDPMATIAFDATETVHLYAKWGTAYRAGGANSRSLIYRAFGPEEVETAEAGLKSEFWDRRVRFNLAAYRTRYKEVQVDFSAVNFVAGRNIGTLETVNTDGIGRINGVEADLAVNPVDRLTLTASYAWTDATLPLAPNPFAANALQKVFIVYTPKNAYSLAADYEIPLDWATLRAHVDANAAGGYHALASEANKTSKSFVVNARLALADIAVAQTRLQLSLWARNLFDEDHTIVVSSSPAGALNGLTGIFNEPRTFGADLQIQF